MNMRPLTNNVLLKRIEKENKTSSGIILPDSDEKQNIGKVISVGIGKRDNQGNIIQPEVKVGDTVYFSRHLVTEIGSDHLIIREDNILGIVER